MIQLGIDVGGTFTDVVALNTRGGGTSWFKVPTTSAAPSDGVLEAIAASGVTCRDVESICLGTTLGVNAILTRAGAKTGLLTTEGFRDVLEIRRTHRQSLFDLDEQFPKPLVPRNLRLQVRERIAADGTVVVPLDEESVRAAWRVLEEAGVEAVAIAFLFSFENPEHERRARDLLLAEGAAVPIFLSSDVLPTYREYERTSTTVAAAYIAGSVERHVRDLRGALDERGLTHSRLAILTNSGGAVPPGTVAILPVATMLSGPVGGVLASRWIAAREGWSSVLTMDMGGTSCDVSGVVDGIPDERLDMVVDGHTISVPTFDIETIGAGGGSIAWVDSGGTLRVGPHSAGASPGPACYGRGGVLPTVTDANLVLGRYDVEVPLGGSIELERAAAAAAIERHVAEPLGLSVEQAAIGVLRIVNVLMMNALRVVSIERGRDVRDFTLVAYGGAGPAHAAEIAWELSIPRVLVPPFPGCASAFGALIAGSRRDLIRTIGRPAMEADVGALALIRSEFEAEIRGSLLAEGLADDVLSLETWLDLRYLGQAYELSVPVAPEPISAGTVAAAVDAFHQLHRSLYGHSFEEVLVELVNLRVKGFGARREPVMWWDWGKEAMTAGQIRPRRRVYFDEVGALVDAKVLLRHALSAGDSVEGPAVVHQLDSTVLVPPTFVAEALESGSLVLHSTASPRSGRTVAAALESVPA
jgi:N-methylhydantoinase A